MNWYIFIAGLIATAATVGHVSVGRKKFLKPMLEASFDPIPKKVMHCLYHYVSTFSCLSAVMLLLVGLNIWSGTGTTAVIYFIVINFLVSAILQIVLAVTSDIPNGLFKLFHWIFFILIALFSFLGIVL
jgi:hypothetical protein